MSTSPTHCSDYREKPPEVTKAKEAVEGRKIRCHIHRSSLGSCLVVQYYTHSTHFWFEPDSCFWSAALHITGRKWVRCISQDVKGEKWRKTPPSPYDSQKWGEKNSQTEWKQIQKINKSTIGDAAEKGNIAKNCNREILNCGCINNLATWDTVFLFTIRFDVTERRDKIRKSFLLLIPRCAAHIWCYIANPKTVHNNPLCRITANLSIVYTVGLLVADAVWSRLQSLVKFQQFLLRANTDS